MPISFHLFPKVVLLDLLAVLFWVFSSQPIPEIFFSFLCIFASRNFFRCPNLISHLGFFFFYFCLDSFGTHWFYHRIILLLHTPARLIQWCCALGYSRLICLFFQFIPYPPPWQLLSFYKDDFSVSPFFLSNRLNSTLALHLEGYLWHQITHKGWHDINQLNPNHLTFIFTFVF